MLGVRCPPEQSEGFPKSAVWCLCSWTKDRRKNKLGSNQGGLLGSNSQGASKWRITTPHCFYGFSFPQNSAEDCR